MENIKKFTFILIAIITFSLGCTKLDENPSNFVTPDKFFTTTGQVEAVFASSMNVLWSAWGGYAYGIQDFKNDDQLHTGDLNIPQNWGEAHWNQHYKCIMNLNATIKPITSLGGGVSKQEIDLLMGQAKFLRAYNYFMLVRMFGGLPLITEDTEDPFNAKIVRSSVADVYKLIISDFTEASAKLPAKWSAAQRGRPTRDAAKGLLAKVYLTMATYPLNDATYYQKAADLAKQVIDGGQYSLVYDIDKVFSLANKYGTEMMWSFISNYQDPTTSPQVWSFDGWGDLATDREWALKYPDQPRKGAYIQLVGRYSGKNYITLGRVPGIQKFLHDTEEDWKAIRSVINMPVIRYADVLLIFAEADNMAKGGPTQAAVDAINNVIDRANRYETNPNDPRATVSMSKVDFDTKVIQERNLELCFELGDRWFDLIRKRILKEVSIVSIQQNFAIDDYLFPIPQKEIRVNPLIIQNPGY